MKILRFAMTVSSRRSIELHSPTSTTRPPRGQHPWGRKTRAHLTTTTTAALTTSTTTRRRGLHNKQTSSSNHEDPDATAAAAAESSSSRLCSTRGRACVGLLPSYLADARKVETYSPSNPDGALQLGVAETQIIEDWLVPALNDMPVLSADAIYYQPTPGRTDFKTALARYIETSLCNLLPDEPSLNLDGLVVGAGCNAVLENLCLTLADPNDAVLIPTPYYAAFEFDLVARAGLFVQPVTTEPFHPEVDRNDTRMIDPQQYYPNAAALDAAYEQAQQQTGKPPKILLISHPMNPLGICYPPETVQECIEWCRSRHVHLVSDEIYAGSVYYNDRTTTSNDVSSSSSSSSSSSENDDEEEEDAVSALSPGFVSALKLAGGPGKLGPYIHWVYAFSKDFGLSGLRVGAAYTENADIMLPLQKLNDLCQISSQTQLWTKHMLEKKKVDSSSGGEEELWTTAFRRENHERLRKRSGAVVALLQKYGIPFLSPTAGLFVWMDLSQFLTNSDSSSDGGERALYLELVHDFGLLFTPGDSMRHERPGFFRCVFTAASDEEFPIALERLERFFVAKKG